MAKFDTKGNRQGFTLVELMVTIVLAAIPIFAIGTILLANQKGWEHSYNTVHKQIQQESLDTITTFGSIARKSNRSNYKVYEAYKGSFTEATPLSGETVAKGQAVEFRFWDSSYDPLTEGMDLLDTTNTGSHYALFYLENDELKVDMGEVVNDIGGVNKGAYVANYTTSRVLAHDVDIKSNYEIFSHTVIGGDGQGCVRMNLKLKDEDGTSVEIKTAALLRIIWPR